MSDDASLAERLGALCSGIVFDVTRSTGHAVGVLPPTINAIDGSSRVAGPAWTVHGPIVEGASAHDTLLDWTRMLSKAPVGTVIVTQPETTRLPLWANSPPRH